MIDASTYIHPSTIIGENVKIGPNCSIGYAGFEYSRDGGNRLQPTRHTGVVVIENNVEILANVAIARGLREDNPTIIGRHTKIDNLVHIAHSCVIGESNALVAGVAFGGNVSVGDYNFFGLNCTIKNGVTVGGYNLIGMGSVVIYNIPDHEIWVGNPAKKLRDNLMFR